MIGMITIKVESQFFFQNKSKNYFLDLLYLYAISLPTYKKSIFFINIITSYNCLSVKYTVDA